MRKRIRLTNETKYPARALRKLLRHALDKQGWPEAAFEPGSHEKPRGMDITVTYRGVKDNSVSGEAYLGGNTIVLRVSGGRFLVDDFIRVAMHEIGHCQGQKHDEMASAWDMEIPDRPDVGQVENGRAYLTEKEPKKTKDDIVHKRYERAKELLSEWETKLKTAKTKRKKYADRVAYYEREYAPERLKGES